MSIGLGYRLAPNRWQTITYTIVETLYTDSENITFVYECTIPPPPFFCWVSFRVT